MRSNSIRINDGSTTSGDHCPYPTLRIEDSELKRSTSRTIELLDVSLFLCEITTEGRWPDLKFGPQANSGQVLGVKSLPWVVHDQQI